jgi:hypothetical protein
VTVKDHLDLMGYFLAIWVAVVEKKFACPYPRGI